MTDIELAIVKLIKTANGDPAHLTAGQAQAVLDELGRHGQQLATLTTLHNSTVDQLGAGMTQIAAKMERELRARIAELEAQVAVFFREAEALRAALAQEKAQNRHLKSWMRQAAGNLQLEPKSRSIDSMIAHLRAFAEE